MTGDEFPHEPHPSGTVPPPPAHVGPSRGVEIALGVLAVVIVFGLAATVGYLVLGKSDTGGAIPTQAPVTVAVTGATGDVTPSNSVRTPTTTTPPSSAPRSVTVTTADGAPDGSRACPILFGRTGLYRASSVGSSVTTCGFAERVRRAYAASGRPGQLPRPITATSPETGQDVEMLCAAQGRLVTCTGGDDAVVYLY